jgi:hypothetical protein
MVGHTIPQATTLRPLFFLSRTFLSSFPSPGKQQQHRFGGLWLYRGPVDDVVFVVVVDNGVGETVVVVVALAVVVVGDVDDDGNHGFVCVFVGHVVFASVAERDGREQTTRMRVARRCILAFQIESTRRRVLAVLLPLATRAAQSRSEKRPDTQTGFELGNRDAALLYEKPHVPGAS